MGKPTVLGGPMPVLDFRRDADYIAGVQLLGRLAPLLVVAPTSGTQEDLSAVVVDVPVVPAGGFKGHIGDGDAAFTAQWMQVTGPAKILTCRSVGDRPGETGSETLRSYQLPPHFCSSTGGTISAYFFSISGVL